MENFNYICHIIIPNNNNKQLLLDEIKGDFNIIDLDKINSSIISDSTLNTLYLKYEKLKKLKNDKFKEVDKEITFFWEKQFINKHSSYLVLCSLYLF